jgi:LmbE family N-acetylglucosaminyl deacetylase
MLLLGAGDQRRRLNSVLCLGAHCDDIEIGCGGTIIRLVEEFPEVAFRWVVLSSDERRAAEARRGADCFLQPVVRKKVSIENFRGSYFPYLGAEIKDYFEQLKSEFSPDLIFTHYRKDLHQDHRLISELTWNTFRNHLILEYEIPKFEGDWGTPNFFVPIDDDIRHRKIRHIVDCFESQRDKHWFSQDTFNAVMRLRGIECNAPSGYAEAFHCRKLVV